MSSKQPDKQKQSAKDAAGSSKGTLPALSKLPAAAAAGADVDTDSQADQQEEAPPQFGLMSKLQSVLDAADDDEEGDTGFEDLQVGPYALHQQQLQPAHADHAAGVKGPAKDSDTSKVRCLPLCPCRLLCSGSSRARQRSSSRSNTPSCKNCKRHLQVR